MNLPSVLLERTLGETPMNPIWLATSFLLQRNLVKYLFPGKMQPHELQQTQSVMKESLIPLLKKPMGLQADQLGLLEREFLYEHFLCVNGPQNLFSHQEFVIDETGLFLAKLNMNNHLQLQCIDIQGKWEESWNILNQMEEKMSSSLDFAFSPKFGFLTAESSYCGTGLTIQAYLHLPALIHLGQLEETLLSQKEEGITVSGISGHLDEIIGDLIVVSNAYTLGVSEENILHSVHNMAMKLMAMEKTLRSHLLTENHTDIKDQVCRAYGLLLHSYQLQIKEALNSLSLMKLALQLKWIEGISESQLDTLFFRCRRAHLLYHLQHTQLTDPQEIAHKRAEFLHKNMQGVTLKLESSS